MKNLTKRFSVGFAVLIIAGFLFLIIGSNPVSAGNTWLKTGTDLLNSVSGGSGENAGVSSTGGPGVSQITDAFKEALSMASQAVVDQVGAADGFNKDDAIHIPLPGTLEKVKSILGTVGLSGMADDLELKLNRAAEAAAPKAKDLFLSAITDMSFEDVKTIYDGPKDSATRYFKEKMSLPLSDEMRPIVDDTLAQVGAVNAYDQLMGKYKDIPFVPDVKADLTQHVLDKGLEGIFYYMAQKEAAIRENPVEQTTELLKSVFGR
ncbi:Protein of unknown function [Desulfocicer vacuolatum DSM 3385]|uniref:DUF4197 domain-containing protein n=1 Tax=Desulfocicer vacuolatum DSM 3385 TaxID=1121400 RepID=A0A1W2BS66_9BACT|nr:DUF4197 domain-containing protein [Desulfocicer vacuolatum]SMC75574.1 Protein of unknown function [Desulfocicer vacuolatum DSM 3385]